MLQSLANCCGIIGRTFQVNIIIDMSAFPPITAHHDLRLQEKTFLPGGHLQWKSPSST